jgi:hypothetical protein
MDKTTLGLEKRDVYVISLVRIILNKPTRCNFLFLGWNLLYHCCNLTIQSRMSIAVDGDFLKHHLDALLEG